MRRLLTSDLKQPDGDAAKVLDVLNELLESITTAGYVRQSNVIDCVVSAAVLPLKVSSPVTNPKCVAVARVTLPTGAPAGVGLSIDWRMQDGYIVISAVYGMAVGGQYVLSLLVV